ncbi:hypothetical protein E1265_25080 [Streptomyces sp. 8K308]|uniref:hypothetical protein n=1 Tax=Streptomyces sp. 8K308 TaxID=2530388 RepID=UPI0010513CF8|nr:hypothetical protein [Streptomyces sp. 8K308]TDC18535.1 hypothetical protein E1265_25080 [Streptomyces sp. 8K308]
MTAPVFRLDLRQVVPGGAGAAEAVAGARRQDARRLLVLDTAAALSDHQRLYEELLASGTPTLCVAVGTPDGPPVGTAAGPVLRRPLPLRPPAAGVLWAPHTACGGELPPDAAVHHLTELLAEPAVFDAVLGELAHIPGGVAVPALRVLERSLSEAARARAWRQALERLAGQPAGTAVPAGSDMGEELPHALAALVGDGVPEHLGGHAWLVPGGEVDARRRACGSALDDARDALEDVRRPHTALRPAALRDADLPGRLSLVADALDACRTTAAHALRDGDDGDFGPEQRARLHRRGIVLPDLPDAPEASREPVGPALRAHTVSLLGRGLSLRAAAGRLTVLARRSHPAGSAARLGRLDRICPTEFLTRLRSPAPFTVGSGRSVNAAQSAAVACAAGLWPGAGWLLGPAAGLACAGLAALLLSRRPNRSRDGRLDGGVVDHGGRLPGGLAGGLVGALAGQLLGLPGWLGLAALLVAVVALVLLGRRWWTTAVDAWWDAMDVPRATAAAHGILGLLAEAAVRDWLLAAARAHCGNVAHAASAVLLGLAAEADRHAARQPRAPDPGAGEDASREEAAGDQDGWDDWDDWDATPGGPDSPGAAPAPAREPDPGPGRDAKLAGPVAPPWLRRETGDGGPVLVETLVGDLTAGVTRLLTELWGGVEAAPAGVDDAPAVRDMTRLLDAESRLLAENPAVLPAFPRAGGPRPDVADLLGLTTEAGDDRFERLDRRADVPDRPLCAVDHRWMLSGDPGAARRVRLVPPVRHGGDRDPSAGDWEAAPDRDPTWTTTGRFTGVVRLVPLRDGVVGTALTSPGGATP